MSRATPAATTPAHKHPGDKRAGHKRADVTELKVARGRGLMLRRGMLGLSVVAVAVLFGLVAVNALIVRTQSTVDDLEGRLAEVRETNQKLQYEIAQLESPERIRTVALEQLGMIEPENVTYLDPISRNLLDRAPEPDPPDQAETEQSR
jgi:cell division protein FtsL